MRWGSHQIRQRGWFRNSERLPKKRLFLQGLVKVGSISKGGGRTTVLCLHLCLSPVPLSYVDVAAGSLTCHSSVVVDGNLRPPWPELEPCPPASTGSPMLPRLGAKCSSFLKLLGVYGQVPSYSFLTQAVVCLTPGVPTSSSVTFLLPSLSVAFHPW